MREVELGLKQTPWGTGVSPVVAISSVFAAAQVLSICVVSKDAQVTDEAISWK